MNAELQKKRWRGELENSILGIAGSILLALGMALFLQPNQITGGGAPGLAILFSRLSGLTAGSVLLLINIPLLILGGRYLGQKFVWRTVFIVVLIAALVDFFNKVLFSAALTEAPILAATCGGAAVGVGVGLILRGNASAGGPTIIARIVTDRTRLSAGRLILSMDVIIVVSSAFVFASLESALLSLLSVVVTGRCIDLVLKGKERFVTSRELPCGSPTT